MDEQPEAKDKVQRAIFTLTKQIITLDESLSTLQASVNVLRAYVATQLSPVDPAEGLKQLAILEKHWEGVCYTNAQERTQTLETISALQAWIDRGRPPQDSQRPAQKLPVLPKNYS